MSLETSISHSEQRVSGLVSTLRLILASLRPWDWTKNAFLFAALFFSKNLMNPEFLTKTFLAFALFCLVVGGIYLINDIWDRHEDERHPQKCHRPIASKRLPVSLAARIAVYVIIAAVSGAFFLNVAFGLVTVAYVLLNIAYSKWLKHVVILDVFSIAAGFMLRVIAGGVVIDVPISHWLLICTMLLALFLGFTKRRYEVVTLANDAILHRRVLAEYNPLFLDMMIGIVTSATVVAYALYTVSPETVERFGTDRLLFTLPFVLYGIFRYLYLVYRKDKGWNPAHALLTDGPLLIDVILWVLVVGLVIYSTTA